MRFKFLYLFFLRALGIGLTFSLNLFVAHFLKIDSAGEFFTLFSIITFFGLIGTSGLCDGILKIWPKTTIEFDEKTSDSIAIIMCLCVLMFSSLLSIIVWGGSEFIEYNTYSIFFIIPLFSLNQFVGYCFQSRGKSHIAVIIINICYPLLFLIFCTIEIYPFSQDMTVGKMIDNLFFSLLLTGFCSISFFYFYVSSARLSDILKDKKRLICLLKFRYKELISFGVILFCNTIVQWSAPILANVFVTSENVALISVCIRIGAFISFFMVSLNIIYAPLFSKIYAKGDFDSFNTIVLKSTRSIFIFSFPTVIFVFLFSPFLLSFFGENYVQASLLLKIITIGQLVNIATGSVAFILTMTGHENIFRNIIISNSCLMVLLILLLGCLFGVIGVAIAISISLMYQNVLSVYFVKKKIGINVLNSYKWF